MGTRTSIYIKISWKSWHTINIPDFDIVLMSSCWCQIANIIWTSTHEVYMMSRICVENDHWQQEISNKKCGWKKVWFIFFMAILFWQLMSQNFHFWLMADGQLMLTVDIILMSVQHLLYTGDADGKMSALCLVLI